MLSKSLSVLLVVYFTMDFSFALPMDYVHVNGLPGVYKFYATKKNWHDAKQVCAEEGASLFYLKDRIEADAAISFWKRYETHNNPASIWIFVGISDIKTEGVFETIDGKPISKVYHGWYYPQPDNSGNEDCVHLNQEGSLRDINCTAEYSFICERKRSPALNISVQPSSLDVQNASEEQKAKGEQKVEDDQLTKKFRDDYHYLESVESFYKIHTGFLFADAKRVCALEGATFWHPANDGEVHAVVALWNASQPIIQWLNVGLADMTVETFDGQFVSEEPNNNLGYESDDQVQNQRCVYMYNNGYKDEHRCVDGDAFVCKKTLQSLERNSQYNTINSDYTFDEDIGKCYKLHTTPLNWNEAYAACHREQSHLAVISNLMEAEYLANLTLSTPNPRVEENYQRGIYHVGFHNQFNDGWQTVTGMAMDADAGAWWDSYKPAHDRAQCGSMFYTGRLVNTDCDMKSFFICEHEIDSEKRKC